MKVREIRARLDIVQELLAYLWSRKLWWLTPMVLVLLLMAVLVALTQGSALAPFLYPLF